ncbi:MAG: TonB-dependent receptor [Bacteroides sp.]|nr:TonB-dependent receptor [Bacteroides sp.]
MKKAMLALSLCVGGSGVCVYAQLPQTDSLQLIRLQEVEVVSTRATTKTPVAFTDVTREQISQQNFGKDIPFLLSSTPSVLTTTDAGAGVGYTSIRVRGTDASHINITTNGIPMNDAESHAIYWVNTPDFASSLEDIQIQRGAGTSTNGAGAFGATINMRTQGISSRPYAELSGSYGSFNTHKETVKIGSGLIRDKWGFDARLSNIGSDGYRDRASADLKSCFLQGGYYGGNTTVKFITFGGKEETYHAWDGISKEMLKTNRRYNPNGEIKRDGEVIGFYDNQIDYYRQMNYQLLVNHIFSPAWNLNVAFHYTDGYGYYEEYKNDRTLVEYRLTPFELNGDTIEKQNLVRRKLVDSDFGGGVFSFNYARNRLSASLGGGLNFYINDHYGKVMWVENYLGDLDPGQEYYRNTGKKTDGNIYAKANYELLPNLNGYLDLQYRYIHYKIDGDNDKWDWTASPGQLQKLNVNETFHFFNPKAGLVWQFHPRHSAYASFSVAQKEPTRNNYTDGLFTQRPKAEKLFDYELGYTYQGEWMTAGANLYYMDYTDQLVLNGQLNEIGEAVAENVKDSYRMGIELSAGFRFTGWLRWDVNVTFSRNRIKNYTEYLSDVNENWKDMYTTDWGISQTTRHIGNTPISFSPDFMGNSTFTFRHKGWEAAFQSQYVGKQYLNNSGSKECTLDRYFVNHLSLSYGFRLPGIRSASVGLTIYNLFNARYESNGYTSGYAVYEGTDSQKTSHSKLAYTSYYAAYYPNAGTNVLAHLTLRF